MPASTHTELLIVGAGPFGLALAAHARHLGVDPLVVGEPMGFWKRHMPKGMYLRSACDWHLDPEGIDTIEAYLAAQGLRPADVEPLSLDRYLDYAWWFQERKHLEPRPVVVDRLDSVDEDGARYVATLSDGAEIAARTVVLAIGFAHFAHVPDDLRAVLPSRRVRHTCHMTDFSSVPGERWLIVGGRQSAFEWAALMAEAGASAIHVSHRHDSPVFAASDWSWVGPLVDGMADNPEWFRTLTPAEQDGLKQRLWAEGRLKLEPWLARRVDRKEITLWPRTTVSACREETDGTLHVTLSTGGGPPQVVAVDGVVLATGYKPDITRVPMLLAGNALSRMRIEHGLPVLDGYLQTTLPGLFITSMPATTAFGPFFAFTVSARVSAKLIGRGLTAS